MQVYANLLGTYVLLDNAKDKINGFTPTDFMNNHIFKYKEPHIFFTVIHDNMRYEIPYNQLECVEPIE